MSDEHRKALSPFEMSFDVAFELSRVLDIPRRFRGFEQIDLENVGPAPDPRLYQRGLPCSPGAENELMGLTYLAYITYVKSTYEVLITHSAKKVLDGYGRDLRGRIIGKFTEIGENPRGTDSKKLDGPTYRVRVGDYRVVYDIDDSKNVVIVTKIAHRREVYR